jgi:hypothetical protein
VDPKLCSAARKLYPGFEIHNTDSLTFLSTLSIRQGATFYWLDAHFPSEKLKTNLPPWPLYEELKLILEKRNFARDAIWCDDMQHILDSPVKDQRVGIDNWRGDERSIQEYIGPFLATHLCYIDGTILRMEPR